MQKKVLAIYYSQSGQLKDIINNFCEPLINEGCEVEKMRVSLKNDFPFPWTTKKFFSVMPGCVLGKVQELNPFQLQHTFYDLIVLGYQAWFLSPSIPFNSLMHDETFLNVVKNTPVITVTGARNMWVNAFEKVKMLLKNAKAKHVGTVALVDKHLNLVSIFSIFHWMLKGKKTKYLNIFPLPGVSDKDILNAKKIGELCLPFLEKNEWNELQSVFTKNKAVDLKYHLMFMEAKAGVMFKLWAKFISKRKNKNFWLAAFKYYLLIALFIFAPIVFLINVLVFQPFFSKHIQRKKQLVLKLN